MPGEAGVSPSDLQDVPARSRRASTEGSSQETGYTCEIVRALDLYTLRSRALPKYISSLIARSSERSRRTSPSNFSIVTLPVKR